MLKIDDDGQREDKTSVKFNRKKEEQKAIIKQ